MSAPLAVTVGPSAYWYLTRSTGAVALILLTLSLVLGVLDVQRIASKHLPRFLIDGAHRTTSLLAVAFLLVHIVTSVLDSFVSISLVDAVVPFVGSYRPLWLGLGALSFDLLIAIVLTSVARRVIGYRTWRATHWFAYACWPIALLHGLGTGSDTKSGWMLGISLGCLLAVLLAICWRAAAGWPDNATLRIAAVSGAFIFAFGLVRWLPGGPLGRHWAERSGTPAAALGSAATTSGSLTTPTATTARKHT
jgi:predicted ferric reductase